MDKNEEAARWFGLWRELVLRWAALYRDGDALGDDHQALHDETLLDMEHTALGMRELQQQRDHAVARAQRAESRLVEVGGSFESMELF
jgi:hypothetical protein